jgi:hypothetical protein
MKLSFTPTAILLSCTLALIPTSTFAQSSGGFGNSGDNRDPFNRASSGDTSGLMQLINQAQLNGSQGNANASGDNQEQLNSATVDFRAQQLKLLRDRNKKSTTAQPAPVVAPK